MFFIPEPIQKDNNRRFDEAKHMHRFLLFNFQKMINASLVILILEARVNFKFPSI